MAGMRSVTKRFFSLLKREVEKIGLIRRFTKAAKQTWRKIEFITNILLEDRLPGEEESNKYDHIWERQFGKWTIRKMNKENAELDKLIEQFDRYCFDN